MGQGVLATYYCHARYGGTYPCSAFAYYLPWIWIPIAIVVGLASHRGYRYRQGRRSRALDDDDAVAGEALLARSRRDLGLPAEAGSQAIGAQPVGRAGLFHSSSSATADAGSTTGGQQGGSGLAPPGWYPDPESPGRQRYWYGNAWAPVSPPLTGAPRASGGQADDSAGWGAAGR